MHTARQPIFYWICLFIAIVFEVVGSAIMKYSAGTSWAVTGLFLMYGMLGLSYFSLSKAVMGLPIGVAYAFWEGLGLLFISIISALLLGEIMTLKRLVALAMVLCGTLLVNSGTGHGKEEA